MWEFIDPIVSAWADGTVPLGRYAPDTDQALIASTPVGSAEPRRDTLKREIGVVGLGKMGAGIARNLVDHGWRTVGFNRTAATTTRLASDGVTPAYSLADLVAALPAPRVVWLMVPAGGAVDDVLFGDGGLAGLLEPGDTVVEGGNSRWSDDGPRSDRLSRLGVRFVDVGVSGGPGGARTGACLLVGGAHDDFERLRPLWADLSLPDGFRHFAGVGAGHFVKMVHNGIEYGMMQALAEGFTVLRESGYDLDLTEAAAVYNRGSVIESRLVGWLESAFRLHGEGLGGVSGAVGHTGEGRWTVEAAAELGVRARVIEEALRFRIDSESDPDWTGRVLSALREQFGRHSAAE
jgi:6-phosphogluconate dehydrogenase